MQNWLDIYGSYEVNGIDVKPVSQAIDKYEEGYFEYYQLFDLDEIDFEENVEINFVANIEEIKEYVECEDLYSNYHFNCRKIFIINRTYIYRSRYSYKGYRK